MINIIECDTRGTRGTARERLARLAEHYKNRLFTPQLGAEMRFAVATELGSIAAWYGERVLPDIGLLIHPITLVVTAYIRDRHSAHLLALCGLNLALIKVDQYGNVSFLTKTDDPAVAVGWCLSL